MNQRSTLASIEHLPAWIRTVSMNTTINYLRKKAREQLLLRNYQSYYRKLRLSPM